MSERSSSIGTWIALLALVLTAGCDEADGPVGTPGGRNGVELRYVTPRIQVLPVGEETTATIAVEVRRSGGDGETVPFVGVALRVDRQAGAGEVATHRIVTDERGVARVEVTMPDRPDRTQLAILLEEDRASFLPFGIATAPVRELDLRRGVVFEPTDRTGGTILRFHAPANSEYVLVPMHFDPDRTGVGYRFLYQAPDDEGPRAAFGTEPPARPHRMFPTAVESGHVIADPLRPTALTPSSAVPDSVNIRSCRIDVDRHAPLRYLGRHVALYVDALPGVHQARIDSLGLAFDESVFPRNTSLFGPTGDRDGNGVVLVVMTPELRGSKGEALGGVYCDSIRTLGIEAFHAAWSPTDPIDRTLATLAHEHQHVINAAHHAETTGGIGDERWLNETLSLAAEALNGFWGTPMVRVWQFLNGQNTGLSMLPFEYGVAFNEEYMMFGLFLGDRFGKDVYRGLGDSGRTGVANVEHVTGTPIREILRDWFVANVVSGLETVDDSWPGYTTLDLHGMDEEIAACRCVPIRSLAGMQAEPLPLDQSFDVFRMFDRFDADYWRLLPDHRSGIRTYDVYFDAFDITGVALSVVRTR